MINSWVQSLGLLVLRVSFGILMLAGHGLDKLLHFGVYSEKFGDPIGVGVYTSLILAIFAEFFCSILLILGIGTRLAAVPLMITMLVALVVVHGEDPWTVKERAALFLAAYVSIFICGGGGFSLDRVLWRWRKRKKKAK